MSTLRVDTIANTAGVTSNRVLQVVNVQDGTVATGTTTFPYDNSIPQNTEGTQFMSLAITPVSATSILVIDVGIGLRSYSIGTNVLTALFKDNVADALASVNKYGDNSPNTRKSDSFSHKMISGTTSTITFKVRAGGNDAGTYTFNGLSGAAYFGGSLASHITITEYQA